MTNKKYEEVKSKAIINVVVFQMSGFYRPEVFAVINFWDPWFGMLYFITKNTKCCKIGTVFKDIKLVIMVKMYRW